MTTEDADKLKSQVRQMDWVQLVALWRWLTLEVWRKMSEGPFWNT